MNKLSAGDDTGPIPELSDLQQVAIAMREFIRHPSDIPIQYDVIEAKHIGLGPLMNVSRGGVCFNSQDPLPVGAHVHIEIPIETPSFQAEGDVAWCQEEGSTYTIGVAFDDRSSAYSVRMVEQVCYIEHYRASVKVCEGRDLTSEEAAQEWVERYAADFPPSH